MEDLLEYKKFDLTLRLYFITLWVVLKYVPTNLMKKRESYFWAKRQESRFSPEGAQREYVILRRRAFTATGRVFGVPPFIA